LEDLTDESQACGEEDHLAATEDVTEPGAGESTKKCTNSEHGDHGSLDGLLMSLDGTVGSDGVHFREGVGEVMKRKEATNARLVVTKQDEGRHDDQQ
jgi:hypothetical protein